MDKPKRQLLVCGACGLAVVQEGDKLIRACDHDKAPLLAPVQATVSGAGMVK